METGAHLNVYFVVVFIFNSFTVDHSSQMIVLLNIQTLDGDFFDQMRGYFATLGQVEVDACKNAMAGFETVVSQANTVSIYSR